MNGHPAGTPPRRSRRGPRTAEGQETPGPNAVARALSVLDCFTADRPLGNSDIAKLTGLPKSTVSRITGTLTEMHYLAFRDDIEKYTLGSRVVVLAGAFHRTRPVHSLIQPALQALADETRSTIGLGVVEDGEAVYLQIARAVSMIMLHVEIGTRMGLLDSALGLALLGASPAALSERILADAQATGTGAQASATLERVRAELESRGYCSSVGTWHEDINGVAVPLRFRGDPTVYAVNIGGPAFIMTEDRLHSYFGPRLLQWLDRLAGEGLVERALPGPRP
jgi:DNA-binding IclR family transcriptional regulator